MTQDEIHRYLLQHRITYKRVAREFGIAESTVKGWFSARGVPRLRLRDLTDLVEKDLLRDGSDGAQALTITLDEYEWEKLHEEANRYGITPQEYAKSELLIRLGLE